MQSLISPLHNMKKLIILSLFIIGMMVTASAQITTMATTVGGTKLVDTTDNAETNYLYIKAPGATYCAIQVVATKISGTPNGSITFEVSVDGVNYTPMAVGDTLHVSNTSGGQTTIKVYDPSPYLYYRVKSVGRGTASYKIQSYYLLRKI